jgi:hypothetical protein
MKLKSGISTLLFFILAIFISTGQEPLKQESTVPPASGTKAQDHNSSRSNKSSSVAAPDVNSDGSETEAKKFNQNSSRSNHTRANETEKPESQASKKGYDYYKSQSDLKSEDAKQKAPGHNSTRSNKSGPK